MATISIQLFGTAQVNTICDGTPVNLSRSALQLLVFLSIHGARPLQRDVIQAELWPDCDPDKARSRLSTAIWRLRKELRAFTSDDVVQDCAGGTLAMARDCFDEVDINRFERAAKAFLSDPAGAQCPYEASGTTATDPLSGWYDVWALSARVRLEDLREHCLTVLLDHQISSQDDIAASETAETLLRIDPLREDVYQALMRIASRQGRPGLVARHYERCREVLAAELGIDPSDETQRLYAEFRNREWETPAASDKPEQAMLVELRRTLRKTQASLAQVSTQLDSLICR